jgi:hypothetical protein
MNKLYTALIAVVAFASMLDAFRMQTSSVAQNKLQMAFNLFPSFSSSSSSSNKFPANKKLCVITGTSSGLGKETAKALLKKDDYFVICACRDVDKMKQIAETEKFDPSKYSIMELDLAQFDSVRKFVNNLQRMKSKPLDRLVCNAAVYQPALPTVSTLSPLFISLLLLLLMNQNNMFLFFFMIFFFTIFFVIILFDI